MESENVKFVWRASCGLCETNRQKEMAKNNPFRVFVPPGTLPVPGLSSATQTAVRAQQLNLFYSFSLNIWENVRSHLSRGGFHQSKLPACSKQCCLFIKACAYEKNTPFRATITRLVGTLFAIHLHFWTICDSSAILSTRPQYDMRVAGVCLWQAVLTASFRHFQPLTDDVEILLEVKERDPTGVQTLPCQLQLQFLLQGWVWAHGVDPHHKTILQGETLLLMIYIQNGCSMSFKVHWTMFGCTEPPTQWKKKSSHFTWLSVEAKLTHHNILKFSTYSLLWLSKWL